MRIPFALVPIISLVAGTILAADSALSGDAQIRAPFKNSEIQITTTARLAGAIDSVKWDGSEFIDSTDHGRQLQSACAFDVEIDGSSETFNPTEAGSRDDGPGATSTSRLLSINASGASLQTLTQMAFWLKPGERSGGKLARNSSALSDYRLAKQVRIGFEGLPNVIEYTAAFIVPETERHASAQFEALTGYMPYDFGKFWRFNMKTGKLEPLEGGPPADPGPAEQSDPVVFSTADARHAMGIFSPDPPPRETRGPSYGRFRFIAEKVTKWNCVFRLKCADKIPRGEYQFHMLLPIGSLKDVETTLAKLSEKGRP